ncbi:MFS family permease [Limimaricola variabilis]|jgi:MFS family permease|uniref:MFS family permease n=1 Tax=Limimaricola variabilis TaxID=1492771 RepID=A0ABR6HPQ8_9RHOB|nr:MFS transporter [Limimaricola variabilis]MBB3712532.1 MFS family permease [Limimaricola variabilis]WPY94743.1 MFS transporter [Limimaricola variabilis]
MIQVLGSSWALFIGMFMLMIGNGLQGTLLGLRGEIEGFSTLEMSVIMSAYFAGFLFASRYAPRMIRRVGHVRVFAALGSTISAVLILYPTLAEPWAWTLGRVAIGFCFCGVYITAESWLNDAASNENRGKALSLYMIVQMAGIVMAQYLVTLGDVSGFILFIIPSVLVSMAFAPILLSVSPAPVFNTTKPLPIRRLIDASPLACMGMFLLGGVFAAQFGMSAVYGARAGLSVAQISLLVSITYVGALVLQFPIGWLSDRIDRRWLILGLSAVGGAGALMSFLLPGHVTLILISAALVGGTSNPLYALLIAYANDYLDREDMAAASGGLLLINGVGAIAGPLLVGWMLDNVGAHGFWAFIAVLMLGLAGYALWRMLRRPDRGVDVADTVSYAPIAATASAVAAEVAQEVYIEHEIEQQEEARDDAA